MPGAGVQAHGLAEQPLVAQAARAAVGRDHPHREAAVQHAALDRLDGAHVQLQCHVGRLVAKRGDGLVDARGGVAGGLVEQRDGQLAAHARVDVVNAGAKAIHRGQQAQCLVVHALALGRQREAGAPAPAQHQAQARFQVLHVAADGADADVQLQLGRRHAAALDHRLEHLQQAQVHVAELPQQGAGTGLVGFYLRHFANKLEYLLI